MTASIPIPGPLKGGRVLDRPNRFTLQIALEPEESVVLAYLAQPDPLPELLTAQRRVWVRATPSDGRRTDWGAVIVQSNNNTLVSLEPELAPALIRAAIDAEDIEDLEGWFVEHTDPALGRSRVDFQLSTFAGEKMLVAVVPVTRVRDGVALYPDSDGEQARRRLQDLTELTKRPGWHATVIFVVQRNDARLVAPDEAMDPQYADVLRAAEAAGVRLIARRCHLTLEESMLGVPIPVDIWDTPVRNE